MDLVDVANLYIASTEKIEFYWNFYVITVLGLVGWLVTRTEPLSPALKVVISLGYLFFVTLNIVALWSSYEFTQALQQDLLAMDDAKTLSHTFTVLEGHTVAKQQQAVVWIHGVLGSAILWVVWWGKFSLLKKHP